jgi:hypothetical protein
VGDPNRSLTSGISRVILRQTHLALHHLRAFAKHRGEIIAGVEIMNKDNKTIARERQDPLRERYKEKPEEAWITDRAKTTGGNA